MPFGFHLAVDTLPSGCLATTHQLRELLNRAVSNAAIAT
jgi:hypothetical protein